MKFSQIKNLSALGILVMSLSFADAQLNTDYLKSADRYYKATDYASATVYYEKYLNPSARESGKEYNPYSIKSSGTKVVKSNKALALFNLAESYRELTYYIKAEPVYSQLLTQEPDAFPLAWYGYAQTLRVLEKYAEAEQALNSFIGKYKTEDEKLVSARRELLNLRYIQQQLAKSDLNLYKVEKIAPGKEGASYAPVWNSGDTILFTATWPDSTAPKNEKYVNHLYQAVYTGGVLGNIEKASLPQESAHQGVAALSADGNLLYFTKWTVNKGQKSAAIYISQKQDGKWTAGSALNNIVNEAGSNAQQPFLSADGKHLFYSSDKKGGSGGYDLWYAELNAGGQPVSSVNMGDVINTPFNEEAPYYHTASGTLVFSTDGRVGMGGYDLFYSNGQPGNWQAPQNFGYPVNSVKDDIYFAARGNSGKILQSALISSDRTATCCLELFDLSKAYKQLFTGLVIDCATRQPLGDAIVSATDATGKQVADLKTDNTGKYSIEAPAGTILTINGSRISYTPGVLITDASAKTDTINNVTLCLAQIVVKPELFKEKKLETRNIMFAFNVAEIPADDLGFLDLVADYLKEHPAAKMEIGAHTDGKGTVAYNLKLSASRARSALNYLVKAGIDKSRLTAKGYGECCPVETELDSNKKDIPEAREKNRRVEFKIID